MAWWHLGLLLPAPASSSTRWGDSTFVDLQQLLLMRESPSACSWHMSMSDSQNSSSKCLNLVASSQEHAGGLFSDAGEFLHH
jgi:hypothetical protein